MNLNQMKQKAAALKKDNDMNLLSREEKSEYYGLLTQIQQIEEDEAAERFDYERQRRKDEG